MSLLKNTSTSPVARGDAGFVAAGEAAIAVERDDLDGGEVAAQQIDRAVGRAVVDADQLESIARIVARQQRPETSVQVLAAVPVDDDDRHRRPLDRPASWSRRDIRPRPWAQRASIAGGPAACAERRRSWMSDRHLVEERVEREQRREHALLVRPRGRRRGRPGAGARASARLARVPSSRRSGSPRRASPWRATPRGSAPSRRARARRRAHRHRLVLKAVIRRLRTRRKASTSGGSGHADGGLRRQRRAGPP